MNISKIVFLTFTIFFSTLSFGADFRDLNLKIGGINLGDDLSQHLSSYQIEQGKKGTKNYYSHLKEPNKFPTVIVRNHPVINKKYQSVVFNIKEIEGKSIIHMITIEELNKKMSVCKRDINNMAEKISQKFLNLEKYSDERKHPADSSGDSIYKFESFTDSKNNIFAVVCTDWSDKITRTKNWVDNLSLQVLSEDMDKWLKQNK